MEEERIIEEFYNYNGKHFLFFTKKILYTVITF